MFAKAFTKFQEKFPPQESLETSELQLTTEEIMRSFEDHGIFSVDTETFYNKLEEAGYVYEPMDDDGKLIFKWLM